MPEFSLNTPLLAAGIFIMASHASILASQQKSSGNSKNLVLEHAIPVAFMIEQILKISRPTEQDIATIIYQWATLIVITKEEDNKLNKYGLATKMPLNWDNIDKFARIKFCEIVFAELQC